jgi:6-pyruvoyltetrahydropterin/6-carboxytetrahydropterin synthase
MITVTKEFGFEAAHRLPLHGGDCANLHGHSYKVKVTVSSDNGKLQEVGADTGMVVDFKRLSSVVRGIIDHGELCGNLVVPWDHATILWENDPLYQYLKDGADDNQIPNLRLLGMVNQPTAENMADLLAALIQMEFSYREVEATVIRVRVWETAESVATWENYDEDVPD